MSVKALTWAFEKYVIDARAKLVLLALADHADDNAVCWPSIETIGVKSCCDRRTVFRKLLELEIGGIITRKQQHNGSGSQTTNYYILNLKGNLPQYLGAGVTACHPPPGDTVVTP